MIQCGASRSSTGKFCGGCGFKFEVATASVQQDEGEEAEEELSQFAKTLTLRRRPTSRLVALKRLKLL